MATYQLFPYGTPVTGKNLIGREEDINNILNDLRGGQSLILPNPRRTGKTSVILESLKRLRKEGFYTTYIDLSSAYSPSDLAQEIASAIVGTKNKRLKKLMRSLSTKIKELLQFEEFKVAYKDFELIAVIRDPNASENDILKASFDLIDQYAIKRKKKLICAFDEFGEINAIDPQILKIMRAKLQHHQNSTYIFSGSQESIIKKVFSNPNEPFYGFAKEIHLGSLDIEDFATYIISTLKNENMQISDDSAFELCRWTATHPYYTKVLANHVYEYALINNIKTIDTSTIHAGYRKGFLSLKNSLERVWSDLGRFRLAKQICFCLATQGSEKLFSKDGLKKNIDSARIAQALNQLETKGILRKIEAGKYRFENLFFEDYIRSLYDPSYYEQFLEI